MGMLLVILTCLASDGHGLTAGGVQGERWRHALGRAAAVAIPLRALFEHSKEVDPWTKEANLPGFGLRNARQDSFEPGSLQRLSDLN